jgi:hypothetical protein
MANGTEDTQQQDLGFWERNAPGWLGGGAGKWFGQDDPVRPTFFDTLQELGPSGLSPEVERSLNLRYGATYNPQTQGFTVANDPYMEKQLANVENYYRMLDTAGAQRAIEGKYQNAAEMARRRAAIFGEQGEQTAMGTRAAFTGGAEDIAGLSQQGGTAVTGLTGPAQGFQSLYGTLPGMGVTAAQDITGNVGFEMESLEDIARAALRSGTKQGRNLADFIANMSANQYMAAQTQLDARNEERRARAVEEILFAEQQSAMKFQSAQQTFGLLLDRGGSSRSEVLRHLGVEKEDQVMAALQQHAQRYGADAVNNLAAYITATTGVGQ